MTASDLSKQYYNLYALTNSRGYTDSAASPADIKGRHADLTDALNMLRETDSKDSISSIFGYAQYAYTLSRLGSPGLSGAVKSRNGIVLTLASTADMYGLLDTSESHAEQIKPLLAANTADGAIDSYSHMVSSYTKYKAQMSENMLDAMI